jgi:hypothetical protein
MTTITSKEFCSSTVDAVYAVVGKKRGDHLSYEDRMLLGLSEKAMALLNLAHSSRDIGR